MTWRPIPTFDGYEASDDGRIRSRRGVLSPWVTNGYAYISLRRDGATHNMAVHRLVLMAFAGLPADGLDACHFNGDRLDNRASNLRWDTRSANALDQVRHGRHNNARKTHCPAGHPYTPENTYVLRGGRRQCQTCTKARAARAYREQAAS